MNSFLDKADWHEWRISRALRVLTKTVKIDQSEGIPGAGIPEPILQALLSLLPLSPLPRFFFLRSLQIFARPLSESLEEAKRDPSIKAAFGYTAAVLKFERFTRLCMGEKNNVDFERLIRENLSNYLTKWLYWAHLWCIRLSFRVFEAVLKYLKLLWKLFWVVIPFLRRSQGLTLSLRPTSTRRRFASQKSIRSAIFSPKVKALCPFHHKTCLLPENRTHYAENEHFLPSIPRSLLWTRACDGVLTHDRCRALGPKSNFSLPRVAEAIYVQSR